MSERGHCTFVKLIERLRAEAEQKGDAAFAQALADCMVHVSGGDLDCPMGQLILEDTLRSGKLPGETIRSTSLSGGSRSSPTPTVNGFKSEEVFAKLNHLLRQEAARREDISFLEALEACARITTSQSAPSMSGCPVRDLLQARKDGQGR